MQQIALKYTKRKKKKTLGAGKSFGIINSQGTLVMIASDFFKNFDLFIAEAERQTELPLLIHPTLQIPTVAKAEQ